MRFVYVFRITIFCLLFNSVFNLGSHAQAPGLENQKQFQIHIHKTAETIRIDGELNEEVWRSAEVATHFSNWSPTDVGSPKKQTECRLTYNDEFLYVGITLYDTNYYIIKTLKRDKEVGESDVCGIVLDPMNQHINGYTFLANVLKVQTEDVILEGGKNDV